MGHRLAVQRQPREKCVLMAKKTLSFAEKLQKKVEEHNSRVRENYALYLAECKRQKVKAGEPIDLLKMVENSHELQES